MSSPRVTVIIPTRGRMDLLKQCLERLTVEIRNQVIVNSGGDLDVDFIRQNWAEWGGLSILEYTGEFNFARANNWAASLYAGESDYLLLLNDDTIPDISLFGNLLKMARSPRPYDVVGAKLLYPDGRIQHAGKLFTLDGYPFHFLRYAPADHPQAVKSRPAPDVTFSCALISRDLWRDLGGLDETFANGFEDDDFCLRALEAGARVGYCADAVCTHLESQTTGMDNDNKAEQWHKFWERWVKTRRIYPAIGTWPTWRFT